MESASPEGHSLSIDFRNDNVITIDDKHNIVFDKQNNRYTQPAFAFDKTEETRFFSSEANKILCNYEGSIARHMKEALMFETEGSEDETLFRVEEFGYDIKPVDAIGYVVKFIASNPNIDKIDTIRLIIPKFFDDRAKTRLIQAVELSGFRVIPDLSTRAYIRDYFVRTSFGDNEFYVIIGYSGATGFELAYWKIKGKKAELLQYNYLDFGGDDITNAYANYLMRHFITSDEVDDETKTLVKSLIDTKNVKHMRILFKEVETKKNSLFTSSSVLLNINAFEHEIKKKLTYKEYAESPEVKQIIKIFRKFLTDSYNQFKESNPEVTQFSFEAGGGNILGITMKQLIKEVFEIDDKNRKVSSFLSSKEAQAEGASYFKTEDDEHEIIDEIRPYTYEIVDNVVISHQNPKVFLPHEEYKCEESLGLWKKHPIRKETKLYQLKDPDAPKEDIQLDKFNEIGMLDIPKEIISQNYASLCEEELKAYKEKEDHFNDLDDKHTKFASIKNDFQATYQLIMKLKKLSAFKKENAKIMKLYEKYDDIFNNKFEDCDDISMFPELQKEFDDLRYDVTNGFVFDVIAKLDEDKQYQTIITYQNKYSGLLPNLQKESRFWNLAFELFIKDHNQKMETEKNTDHCYEKRTENFYL